MKTDANLNGLGELTDSTTLVIRRVLPGPVERIWRYLIDGEQRRKWLAAGDMQATAGSEFELVWRNDELSHSSDRRPAEFPAEQRMQSRVIVAEPPRLLTIEWGEGDVTFQLEAKGDDVLLTLTHRGLDNASARTMIAAGWHMHLEILIAGLYETQAESFWSGWAKLEQAYTAHFAG